MSVEAACAVEGTACCACAASGKAATPAIIAMKRRLRIGPYLCWVSLQLSAFKQEIQAAECLPWWFDDQPATSGLPLATDIV